jgi:hypothetical protein
MLKTIPKSSVNRRSFKVHKNWTVTHSNYSIISASLGEGYYDIDSSVTQSGFVTSSLYSSIKSKYFQNQDNIFNLFGSLADPSDASTKRNISDTIYVIPIPQNKYGERIKPGSLQLTDNNGVVYIDDSQGNVIANTPIYVLVSVDLQDSSITIQDADGDLFIGTIISMDFQTGVSVLTFGSETKNVTVVRLDFQNNTLETATPLEFEGLDIDQTQYGNIFYSDGLLVFTGLSELSEYSCTFKSTKTIHETEVLISSKAGEFNYSQNPSAVDVTLSGSYDFTTTAVTNVSSAQTKKIKEVRDISQKSSYTGSYGSTTGTWNDYFTNASTDPTGSYLTTYISTIGLYDNDGDMVAVAKLPTPIKNLPDYDVNFIVRFDT